MLITQADSKGQAQEVSDGNPDFLGKWLEAICETLSKIKIHVIVYPFSETLWETKTKGDELSRAERYIPIIPALWEAEAGRLQV